MRFSISLACALATFALSARTSAQWQVQTSPTDVELRGLSVVSPTVVWASGQRGTVVHTRDGGAHWTRDTIPGAGALDLRAIAATSATTAHAISIGDSSRVYRTTDGGRTWSLRWSATRKGTFLDAIRFWDARHGIAMSDPVDGKLLLSDWKSVSEPVPGALTLHATDGTLASTLPIPELHGPADFDYDAPQRLVWIPDMQNNRVVILPLPR